MKTIYTMQYDSSSATRWTKAAAKLVGVVERANESEATTPSKTFAIQCKPFIKSIVHQHHFCRCCYHRSVSASILSLCLMIFVTVVPNKCRHTSTTKLQPISHPLSRCLGIDDFVAVIVQQNIHPTLLILAPLKFWWSSLQFCTASNKPSPRPAVIFCRR